MNQSSCRVADSYTRLSSCQEGCSAMRRGTHHFKAGARSLVQVPSQSELPSDWIFSLCVSLLYIRMERIETCSHVRVLGAKKEKPSESVHSKHAQLQRGSKPTAIQSDPNVSLTVASPCMNATGRYWYTFQNELYHLIFQNLPLSSVSPARGETITCQREMF